MIRRTQAPVLPLFFEGRNPWWFQAAGVIHPRLRTLLLPRMLAKPACRQVHLHVGKPIPHARLESLGSDTDLLAYLRMRTYLLKPTGPRAGRRAELRLARRRSVRQQPLITTPVDPQACSAELSALSSDSRLAESGELEVWFARADQIPNILREIGRLREISFRAAGEGTGQSLDLDRFDRNYGHLFVWNRQDTELVGAYRLGLTDEILPRYGLQGLYTSTLFKFARRLLSDIQPAIELGRSFVRPEYQRQHSPLALLWRGIGLYVAANPRYKTLFGPVSISNRYQSVSQRVMIAFLQTHLRVPEVAELVKPRNPPRWRRFDDLRTASRLLADINEVSSMVADIEADDKGVPVLLRQYLRLNAKFVCCNRDPDFGGVIDGLMIADLTRADRRILERHMSKEGVARFLAFHQDRARRAG
jgi:putative hemolysin